MELDTLDRLFLGPALVVLSACRTGEGELVPGEGLIGLGRTFLGSGASGVVVSMWDIEDRTTADLMVALHGHLHGGHDPVRALSLAARTAARHRPHPAYWAPFTTILRPDILEQ
jgi:CHAT domain-containing protein